MKNYSGLWKTSEGKQGALDHTNKFTLVLKLLSVCLDEMELNGNAEWEITDNTTDEIVLSGTIQA